MIADDLRRRLCALAIEAQGLERELRLVRDGPLGADRSTARYLQRDVETLARAAQRAADRLERERRI